LGKNPPVTRPFFVSALNIITPRPQAVAEGAYLKLYTRVYGFVRVEKISGDSKNVNGQNVL